ESKLQARAYDPSKHPANPRHCYYELLICRAKCATPSTFLEPEHHSDFGRVSRRLLRHSDTHIQLHYRVLGQGVLQLADERYLVQLGAFERERESPIGIETFHVVDRPLVELHFVLAGVVTGRQPAGERSKGVALGDDDARRKFPDRRAEQFLVSLERENRLHEERDLRPGLRLLQVPPPYVGFGIPEPGFPDSRRLVAAGLL